MSDSAAAVVLDTHALVWLLQGDERLGVLARGLIQSAASADAAWVPAISAWEIAMLVAKGRLVLDREVGAWLDTALALPGLRLAPLEPRLAVDATRLPGQAHGDPADRLIIATARHHGATLVTQDKLILDYAAQGHVRAHRADA